MGGILILVAITAIWALFALILTNFGVQASTLIVAAVGGMITGAFFPKIRISLSKSGTLVFATRWMLRAGIVLYGLRLGLSQLQDVGIAGISVAVITVVSVLGVGVFLGRVFGMDKESTLLVSAGSAICGAAAILAVQSVVQARTDKVVVAVATVVVFGTLGMLIYPLALEGINNSFVQGLITGGTLHEVAHVVGAGSAMGEESANTAIIVKMIRVMLLVPVLFVLAWKKGEGDIRGSVPWFALGFIAVVGLNSIVNVPFKEVWFLLDTALLSVAMCALGIQTEVGQIKRMGPKPFLLAFTLMGVLALIGLAIIWIYA